jgi:hypothetical protein
MDRRRRSSSSRYDSMPAQPKLSREISAIKLSNLLKNTCKEHTSEPRRLLQCSVCHIDHPNEIPTHEAFACPQCNASMFTLHDPLVRTHPIMEFDSVSGGLGQERTSFCDSSRLSGRIPWMSQKMVRSRIGDIGDIGDSGDSGDS